MPQVAFYASYTTSFNPLVGTTFDGLAFEPEQGVQYEAGVKLDLFGGLLTSTLAVYHLTKENVLTDDPVNLGFSIQIGEQRSRGVEVDIAGEVLPSLRLIASYAYTDAKITKSTPLFGIPVQGNRPANVPEHSGSVWGVYDFQDGFLRGGALEVLTATRIGLTQEIITDHALSDLHAGIARAATRMPNGGSVPVCSSHG